MFHDPYSERLREESGIRLRVIDTENSLTKEELVELKRLASMSKIARYTISVVIGVLSVLGLPAILDWGQKLFSH
jgi:hypothetical protein